MRPLTPKEIARARRSATHLWHPVWRRQAFATVLALVVVLLGFPSEPGLRVLLGALLLVACVAGLFAVWWGYRSWLRRIENDLQAGVVEQRAGVLEKRSWADPHNFPLAPKYVVWAPGLQLLLDRSEFAALQPGNRVLADYLPRTKLVIAAQKVASP